MSKARHNEAPRVLEPLVAHGFKLLAAAERFGTEIGLLHHTAERIRADLWLLVGDGESAGAQGQYNEAKLQLAAARLAHKTVARRARDLLRACMTHLKPVLGYTWNARWNGAGFGSGSIALPRRTGFALQQFAAFLRQHPEYENALFGMTAETAEVLVAEFTASECAVRQCDSFRKSAKQKRDAALRALYKRAVGVRRELVELLAADDSRWTQFGFRIPAEARMPDAVSEVNVREAEGDEVIVSWEPSARATSYRVIVRRGILDSEPLEAPLTSGTELVVKIPSRGPGDLLLVSVSAINAAGETPPTEVSFVAGAKRFGVR